MHIGEPTSQSKVARAARIFAVASCTAAMLATLLAAAPTQAQTYQAPSSFVSGTAGAGGQTSFRFGTATDVTVTFSTAFTTTGGIYSYGVRTASSTIGAIGNNSNAYLTGATTASLGSLLDLWGYGCAIPGIAPATDPNTGQLCVNRGTLTVTFSQPVVNPIIHLGGLGSSEVIASPGLHYAAEYTVASAANGASPVAATLSALSGSAAFAVTGGNKVQNSGPASSVSATCAAAAPGAACGSTRVNGTVTSVTFDVGLRGYGTQSQGTSTPTGYFQNQGSGYTDGHTVSASIAPQADLRVSKTDNQTVYTPSQAVTYVLVVANAGPNTVVGASLVDNLPASLLTPTWTATYAGTGASGPAGGTGSINTSAITLPPGGTATFTVNATVSGAATGNLVNTASVAVPAGVTDPVPGNNSATDTDTKRPILRLRKSLPNGRTQAADQFVLAIAGAGGPVSATTTGATTAPSESAVLATATAGSAYTLSETGGIGVNLASYVSTYTCTNANAGGQTPSGNGTGFGITPVAGDDLTCVFSNAALTADLSILKTASAPTVQTGDLVTFTLTVANAGPSAANGAVVRDTPHIGLDCLGAGLAAPTCGANGGASCPGSLTNAGLLSSGGVAVPLLPAGGGVAITLQCRMVASGAS